ncbi:MAG: hypothetical protein ACUVWB_04060 [Anaerolineae bacterium]
MQKPGHEQSANVPHIWIIFTEEEVLSLQEMAFERDVQGLTEFFFSVVLPRLEEKIRKTGIFRDFLDVEEQQTMEE